MANMIESQFLLIRFIRLDIHMRMCPTRVPFEWKVNQWYVYCIIVSAVAKWSGGMKLHKSLLKQLIFPLVRIADT
jgi:hypothetical protein